jgi:hypothetical protein
MLVEHEQRMITGTTEVAVIGRVLLLPVHRAFGTVDVQDLCLCRQLSD